MFYNIYTKIFLYTYKTIKNNKIAKNKGETMDPIAKEKRLKNKWVCMKCNHVMHSLKKPEFCRKCGSSRIRTKKKGKRGI